MSFRQLKEQEAVVALPGPEIGCENAIFLIKRHVNAGLTRGQPFKFHIFVHFKNHLWSRKRGK